MLFIAHNSGTFRQALRTVQCFSKLLLAGIAGCKHDLLAILRPTVNSRKVALGQNIGTPYVWVISGYFPKGILTIDFHNLSFFLKSLIEHVKRTSS